MHRDPVAAPGWQARLDLAFERRGARSVLAARRHVGPLVVQKTLHPEGDEVCHGIVLHPPSGICGGDALTLKVAVGAGAHALLTTPGAGKWYRSHAAAATQDLDFALAAGGTLEWLPQESIVFDGARAAMQTTVRLAARSRFVGWEILCLGRTLSGERFDAGRLRLSTRIEREGRPLWLERGRIDGGAELLRAPIGLAGQPVCATLLAAGMDVSPGLLAQLREPRPAAGEAGVSALPQLFVARHLGPSAQAARDYFVRLWRILRPALLGREAVPPRIWST